MLAKSSSFKRPVIAEQSALEALKNLYGIEGKIKILNGERDKNFQVICNQSGAAVKYVFKIANTAEDPAMLECQEQVFYKLQKQGHLETISPIKSLSGRSIEQLSCDDGAVHYCRLTSWLEGELFSSINPQPKELLQSLGQAVARTDLALEGFQHPALQRPLLWKMQDCLEILDRFKPLLKHRDQIALIDSFERMFEQRVVAISAGFRQGVIHNDANDNNIIVRNAGPWDQQVVGLIDFGDMVNSWTVVDPAVACAYAMLDKPRPLDTAVNIIGGYHQVNPLNIIEMQGLFSIIAMRLCMSVCICAYQKSLDPDNDYLAISEQPAWRTLERLSNIPPDYAYFAIRDGCEIEPVPSTLKVSKWLAEQDTFDSIVNLDLTEAPLLVLDTSVSSPHLGPGDGSHNPRKMSQELFRAIDDAGARAGIGRYDEYRLIYNSEDFVDFSGHRRTLHLGIDIFQPAGSPVFAPLEGRVFSMANHVAPLDYGGIVILQHRITGEGNKGTVFYTLYGHLDPESFSSLESGQEIASGQQIASMGDIHQNGQWPPHVHFEIITNMLDETSTFVGVGTHAYRNVWLGLCPDPNLILRIPEALLNQPLSDNQRDRDKLLKRRNITLSGALSLSYREPIVMARGAAQYLFDATGRRYLDAVNNVPHVGHCHPHVVHAGQSAAGVLNTNTRYLYPSVTDYAERLLATFPDPLSVVLLVNSGSEANDLALRLAWCHTGRRDMVVLDHAYHGNLTALIGLSPYKHDGPGGAGTPEWVHKVAMPDGYRGQFKSGDPDIARRYAELISSSGSESMGMSEVAAFICEPMPGCGGQIILPAGYLARVYQIIRQTGGLCIADEVQTGFGRVGSHFWAFETQQVVPDIVTIGKPAGNGHPLAAVVTTREVADSFANGMEYFNTFGGNSVSCAIGNAVLDVIENQDLQSNALETGTYLIKKLQILKDKFPLIGDVRGAGLFIGVELVNNRLTLEPAARQASYIAERMKQEGILISTDGPYHNVLKIKPPLVFNKSNADHLLSTLKQILAENWSLPG